MYTSVGKTFGAVLPLLRGQTTRGTIFLSVCISAVVPQIKTAQGMVKLNSSDGQCRLKAIPS